MDKRNLMPQSSQPVNRFTTGQLPPEAELSEEALQQQGDGAFCTSVLPQIDDEHASLGLCSYDGDDAE